MNSFKLDGVLFTKDKTAKDIYNCNIVKFNIDENKKLFILVESGSKYVDIINIECAGIFIDLNNICYLYFSNNSYPSCPSSAIYWFRRDILFYSSNFELIKKKKDNLNLLC